ncbi:MULTISPECIES: hypothetical protein [Micromonospora]|uniref:hypothetical protein n=1 Tax=Micromonospora TaxID=1873 RepID=UPI000B2A19FF|nr:MULTISPECIES: hypothetical protein [unclassified Micromonospora]MDG4756143.1 hypothetical protein [Micromonospora sp. WMMD718]
MVTADSMRRAGRWAARCLLIAVACLAVMPAASPASADPAEDQAATEVAAARCAKAREDLRIPRPFVQVCESRLVDALKQGAVATGDAVERVCEWLPDLPLVGDVCGRVKQLMAGIAEEYQQRLAALRAGVDFAKDPWGQTMNRVADHLATSLSDLLTRVVTNLAHLSAPDVRSTAFVQSYAAGSGIAMFVLVAMLARVFYKAGSGEMTGEELADSVWRRLPWAMVLVLFGPGLGYLLVQLSNGATASIMAYFATDVASLAAKLNAMAVPANMGLIPGGPLIGILIVVAALVGAFALLVGLLVQLLTLYLTGAVMAIAFVLAIDPATRPQAQKLPTLWLWLLAGRPLVFFLLGVVAKYGDSSFSVAAIQDDGMRALVSALVAALMLLFVGFAPWAVVKFAPVLPGGGAERIARSKRSSNSAFSGVASSAMMQLAYRRMSSGPSSDSGGSGGSPRPAEGHSEPGPRSPQRQGASEQSSAQPPSTSSGSGQDASDGGGRGGQGESASSRPNSGTAPLSGTAAPPAAGPSAGAGGGASAGAGAGAGAAGGAGVAAGAGATVATGGVAAGVLLAAQAAAATKQKIDDAAHRAGDVAGD